MLSVARHILHSVGPLHRALSRSRGTLIHSPSRIENRHVKLGSSYGGWAIIPELLSVSSVVYSVGVGSDVSFDLALIAAKGCDVHAFDPTPVAVEWVGRQALPPQFRFHAIGLAATDAEVPFRRPLTDGHVSFSLAEGGAVLEGETVLCPVRRLETLTRDLGHTSIDLLKMDIEGFEYQVIRDILSGSIRPRQWLIEFHHAMYSHKAQETVDAVDALLAAGYTLFSVSNVGHEYSFVYSK